jgi:hypothetical protein
MNVDNLAELVAQIRLINVFQRIQLFPFHSPIPAVRDKPVKTDSIQVHVALSIQITVFILQP